MVTLDLPSIFPLSVKSLNQTVSKINRLICPIKKKEELFLFEKRKIFLFFSMLSIADKSENQEP